jgi:ribosomal protein S18 acetylase RimI-like enzyme
MRLSPCPVVGTVSGVPAASLRLATAADAEAIATLHADSWRRFYRGAYADSFLDGDVEADRKAVWSQRLAVPQSNAVTIVAENDVGFAGFVHVILDHDERWGSLIDNLHVSHTGQRSGIGSALITSAGRSVVEHGSTAATYLWVLEQNASAQAFYTAHGGRPVERGPVAFPGGVPGRLNGRPMSLRFVWPDARDLKPYRTV